MSRLNWSVASDTATIPCTALRILHLSNAAKGLPGQTHTDRNPTSMGKQHIRDISITVNFKKEETEQCRQRTSLQLEQLQ